MLCVQSSNVSKLVFASDDLIKVWIIQNTRFSPISWFSCRSRICSLTRFLNSNPFEFKNRSRCRRIISNKGSDYKTTIIKFLLVQNCIFCIRWPKNDVMEVMNQVDQFDQCKSFGGHQFKDILSSEFLM